MMAAYIGDAEARAIGQAVRGEPGSALPDVLDQLNGVVPLRVRQAVQVFAKAQTVLEVGIKVAGL